MSKPKPTELYRRAEKIVKLFASLHPDYIQTKISTFGNHPEDECLIIDLVVDIFLYAKKQGLDTENIYHAISNHLIFDHLI